MTVIHTHIFIINLNTDSLNSATKRHKLTGWIRKQNPSICYFQEVYFSFKDSHYFRVKRWTEAFQSNRSRKQASTAILLSEGLFVCLFLVKIKWGKRAGTSLVCSHVAEYLSWEWVQENEPLLEGCLKQGRFLHALFFWVIATVIGFSMCTHVTGKEMERENGVLEKGRGSEKPTASCLIWFQTKGRRKARKKTVLVWF